MDIDYKLILTHYCDINQIPYHSSRDAVIEYILANPNAMITYQTPYGRVFDLISQLINKKISLEDMMSSGDDGHPTMMDTLLRDDADCIVYDQSLGVDTSMGSQKIIIIL